MSARLVKFKEKKKKHDKVRVIRLHWFQHPMYVSIAQHFRLRTSEKHDFRMLQGPTYREY